jgi:hypothetical protein
MSEGAEGLRSVSKDGSRPSGRERTASATAISRVQAMVLPQRAMLDLIENKPKVAAAAIRFLCTRLRDTDQLPEAIALHRIERSSTSRPTRWRSAIHTTGKASQPPARHRASLAAGYGMARRPASCSPSPALFASRKATMSIGGNTGCLPPRQAAASQTRSASILRNGRRAAKIIVVSAILPASLR